jgi:O-antigen/teichoic acid export membrane protein
MFRDVGLTAVTQFATFAGGLLVISLLGRLLGPALLGEYLLVRRIAAWLKSGTEMGLGIALPRTVAHALQEPSGGREAYFAVDAACVGTAGITLGVVLYLGRTHFAEWFFGERMAMGLIVPLSLFLLGLLGHAAVYGYYRGRLAMARANAVEFIDLALIPVSATVFFWRTHSVAAVLSAIGAATLLSAACFARNILRERSRDVPWHARKRAAELLRYGLARVPGEFGSGALLSLGPIIASHFLPMAQVSSLLLGMSLLMAVSLGVTPLGLVLLSKVSMMLAQDRLAEIRVNLAFLLAAVLELSIFVCLQVVVFADTLIRTWVGDAFPGRMGVIRIVALAIPPFLFYVTLRSVIDATSVKAYNARSILIALGVFLTLAFAATKILPPDYLLEGIATALLCAFIVLAALTARTVRRLYNLRLVWRDSGFPLLVGFLLGGASFIFHWANGFRTSLAELVLLQLTVAAIFFCAARKFRSGWLPYLWSTISRAAQEPQIADLNA